MDFLEKLEHLATLDPNSPHSGPALRLPLQHFETATQRLELNMF